jgi:pteridine reductase
MEPSPRELNNAPVALVTGAGTRVGKAIVEELANAGHRIAIHYGKSRNEAFALRDTLRSTHVDAECYQANLEHRDETRKLVDRVVEDFGKIDLLVPSAALFENVRIGDISDAAWDRVLETNLSSSVILAQQAVPWLKETQGCIVFITCSSVCSPYRFHLPYVVSKAGLYQAMRAMALELAPSVRVNAVAPGTVLPPETMTHEELETLRRRIPLQRFGCPADVARAVRFLFDSPFVTGQQIVVDGGRSLGLVPDGS